MSVKFYDLPSDILVVGHNGVTACFREFMYRYGHSVGYDLYRGWQRIEDAGSIPKSIPYSSLTPNVVKIR